MGAVTVSNRAWGQSVGKSSVVEADVTFSASYATGGDTIDPRQVGLRVIREVLVPSHDIKNRKVVSTETTRHGRSVELVGGGTTAPKLALYESANVEATAGTNLTGRTLRLRFVGY